MADGLNINTKADLADYCLRKLGFPAIDIEIDQEQIDDRIEEALRYWHDIHYDGYEKIYLARKLTAQDILNAEEKRVIGVPDQARVISRAGYNQLSVGKAHSGARETIDTSADVANGVNIVLDDSIKSVSRVLLPSLYSVSGTGFFSYQYRARLAFYGEANLTDYYFFRMQLAEIRDMFQHEPVITFKRHTNHLTVEGTRFEEGQWLVIECNRRISPFRMPKFVSLLSGTITEYTEPYVRDDVEYTDVEVKIDEIDEDILRGSTTFSKLLDNPYVLGRHVVFPQLAYDLRVNSVLEYKGSETIPDPLRWKDIIASVKEGETTIKLRLQGDFRTDVEDDDTFSLVVDTKCHEARNDKATGFWNWTDDTLQYIFPDGDLYGYRNVWRDRFVRDYAYLLIKRQWGEILKKFEGVVLPGGAEINGQQIYEEADEMIREIDENRIENFSAIPLGRFG